MLSLLLATVLSSERNAYFPMNPGDTYVYSELADNDAQSFSDTVGDPTEIGGVTVYPITTRSGVQVIDTVYHQVTRDAVRIVAYADREPLASPYSVLELRDGRGTSWNFAGTTQFLGGEDTMVFRATSRNVGRRNVLGQQREVVEVRMDITLSGGAYTSVQTSLYAEGLGLYEMKETSRIGSRSVQRSRELVRYEPAGRRSG